MVDEERLRTVNLVYPQRRHHNSDSETWLSLLEQFLLCEFKDYTITVCQDSYLQTTNVSVRFASIEDATFFRLQRQV